VPKDLIVATWMVRNNQDSVVDLTNTQLSNWSYDCN